MMKVFNVYVCNRRGWEFWMAIEARDRNHAEAMVLGTNPPGRFIVYRARSGQAEASLTGGHFDEDRWERRQMGLTAL
jgi:hypothetical protein